MVGLLAKCVLLGKCGMPHWIEELIKYLPMGLLSLLVTQEFNKGLEWLLGGVISVKLPSPRKDLSQALGKSQLEL